MIVPRVNGNFEYAYTHVRIMCPYTYVRTCLIYYNNNNNNTGVSKLYQRASIYLIARFFLTNIVYIYIHKSNDFASITITIESNTGSTMLQT